MSSVSHPTALDLGDDSSASEHQSPPTFADVLVLPDAEEPTESPPHMPEVDPLFSPEISGDPLGDRQILFLSPKELPVLCSRQSRFPRVLQTHHSNLAGLEHHSSRDLNIANAIATMLWKFGEDDFSTFFGLSTEKSVEECFAEGAPVTFVREEADGEAPNSSWDDYGIEKKNLLFSRKGNTVIAGFFKKTPPGLHFPNQVIYTIDPATSGWEPSFFRYDTYCEDIWGNYGRFQQDNIWHLSHEKKEVTVCGARMAKEWLAMRKWEGTEERLEDGEMVKVGFKVERRMIIGDLKMSDLNVYGDDEIQMKEQATARNRAPSEQLPAFLRD